MEIKNKVEKINDLSELRKKHPDIPSEMYPNLHHHKLSFELLNSCTSFANAIRRCCINEIPIKYLNVTSLDTNDKYQLPEVIINRINQISLVQSIDENLSFYLRVVNDTDKELNVYTSDMKILVSKSGSKKNNVKELDAVYFNNNIRLCSIRSNTYIEIYFDIKKEKGENDAKYSLCCIKYDILDMDTSKSTLAQNNSHFYLSIRSFGNITPKDILSLCTRSLTDRLYDIKLNLEHDNIKVLRNNKIVQYYIKNESHTISNLLTEYIYRLNPEIELVNAEYVVVPRTDFYLCLIVEEPKKVILEAIDVIVKDLNLLMQLIKK